jgi:hypothetical protein
MTQIDFESLTKDITQTTKTHKQNPIHYVVFNESKITIDGKEYTLNQDGWDLITKTFKTSSGSLIAKRLLALIVRLNEKPKK